ncbi:hypothetical protein TB2_021250 [Malus domestica]
MGLLPHNQINPIICNVNIGGFLFWGFSIGQMRFCIQAQTVRQEAEQHSSREALAPFEKLQTKMGGHNSQAQRLMCVCAVQGEWRREERHMEFWGEQMEMVGLIKRVGVVSVRW